LLRSIEAPNRVRGVVGQDLTLEPDVGVEVVVAVKPVRLVDQPEPNAGSSVGNQERRQVRVGRIQRVKNHIPKLLSQRTATTTARVRAWVRYVQDDTFGDVSSKESQRRVGPNDAGAVALRLLVRADYPMLALWRRDQAWLTWWGPERNENELEDDYGATIDGMEPTLMFVATEGSRDIGLVETYRHTDHPTWHGQIQVDHAIGIDYGIGVPRDRGRGLGRAMLTVLIDEALDLFPDCDCVVAVPKSANRPSCALLESLGFTLHAVKPVEGEWPTEGTSSIYRLTRDAWSR